MSHAYRTLTVSCDAVSRDHAYRLLEPFVGMIQRKDWHAFADDGSRGELAIMVDVSELPVAHIEGQLDIIALALEPAGCRRRRTSTCAMRAVREDT